MWRSRDRKTSHGEGHFIIMALRNGPLTHDEICNTYQRFGGLLGIPTPALGTGKYDKWQKEVDEGLSKLIASGLIDIDENKAYRLTASGTEEAKVLDRDLQTFTRPLRAFFASGKTAAKVSIFVNILLSVLKLAVGFLFNSMALIADGLDNVVDVVSSAVVFLGIKYRKELLSTAFIIIVMFITGIWIGYESVIRLFSPEPVEAGLFTVAAALISGLVCYLMSLYQYTIGKNTGSLSLISQSIDSRNHVFVAGAVLAGIIFAFFGIYIVDSIVGLAVAVMIVKSAVELSIETWRIASGEELDLTKFTRTEEKAFEKHRRDYFKSWLLFSLRETGSREEIVSHYRQSYSTEGLPLIDHFTFLKGFDFENHVDAMLGELVAEGMTVRKEDQYILTEKGKKLLNTRLAQQRFRDL